MLSAISKAAELIAKKKCYLMPCLYHFYQNPPVLVRGSMQYLYDAEGKKYLDCYSGVGVVSAGHCNPEITNAICEQVKMLQHTTSVYLTEPMMRLAEKLANSTGGNLPRSFFCNSGSEANDGAVLMAKIATGRETVLSLTNSLHGRTHVTMGLTEIPMWRIDPFPYGNTIRVASFANPQSMQTIESTIRNCDDLPAAIIAEPIQGNGGIHVAPSNWLLRLREICDRYGILFIADEVQTGINRTGAFWALEHSGVQPDIIVTAKALGNGQPVAAILTTEAIAEKQTAPGASTFGGNPVSMTAALATLEFHEKNNLRDRAQELGEMLFSSLKELMNDFDFIIDVRGRGLMIGMELDFGGDETTAAQTDMILESLKDQGVLCGKTGVDRNVLTFLPPLVIEQSDIEFLVSVLRRTLKQI